MYKEFDMQLFSHSDSEFSINAVVVSREERDDGVSFTASLDAPMTFVVDGYVATSVVASYDDIIDWFLVVPSRQYV